MRRGGAGWGGPGAWALALALVSGGAVACAPASTVAAPPAPAAPASTALPAPIAAPASTAAPAPSSLSPAPPPSAFARAFDERSRRSAPPLPLPPDVRAAARRYRYVFVAGFLNEGMRAVYFSDNRRALADAGVDRGAVHVLYPGSGRSVEDNIAELGRTLPALAAAGPEKLVVIGHSKGAVEALGFALGSPAFVRAAVP